MRGAVVLVLVGVLFLVGCDGAQGDAADRSVSPPTEQLGEPIATGEVLEGSTLGGSPFCAGGTILDSHASGDPAVEPHGLIDRTVTCPDGSVRMGFTPEVVPQGQTQTGSWTIVSGTGAFEDLRGSGEMEVVKDPDDDSLDLETLTGTVTRSS